MPSLPISESLASELCFGDNPGEWEAFCAGWQYFEVHPVREGAEPEAKWLGLYPENQNLRISWQRGWLACQAVMLKLVDF